MINGGKPTVYERIFGRKAGKTIWGNSIFRTLETIDRKIASPPPNENELKLQLEEIEMQCPAFKLAEEIATKKQTLDAAQLRKRRP
jgi:hypothetical protein